MLDVRCKILFVGLVFCVNGLFAQKNNKLIYDTTTTAIIEFDKKDEWQKYYIDTTCRPSSLNQNDLKVIDSILLIVMIERKVGDTSLLRKQNDYRKLDSLYKVSKYYKENGDTILYKQTNTLASTIFYNEFYVKQIIPFKNNAGDSVVFLNVYYCSSVICGRWINILSIPSDGGNCCFRFKINLTTKKYFDFDVNDIGG